MWYNSVYLSVFVANIRHEYHCKFVQIADSI